LMSLMRRRWMGRPVSGAPAGRRIEFKKSTPGLELPVVFRASGKEGYRGRQGEPWKLVRPCLVWV
jgi:hypothetical protein